MILVFGRTGQVARALARLAPQALYLGRDRADLSDPAACAAAIRVHAPDAVINAAAFTAVDAAEDAPALAQTINADAPTAMAAACAAQGIPFVHLSTDHVFDGTGQTAFTPNHPTAPLNTYGRTKLAGEMGVRAAGGTHVILRTAWVFSLEGQNFLTTMLRLGRAQGRLRVVADQIGGPTPASAVASACLHIARRLHTAPDKSGTYHLAGQPAISRADFARAILAEAGLACEIENIATTGHPTPARRPLNATLDCAGLQAFGLHAPDWQSALRALIRETTRTA